MTHTKPDTVFTKVLVSLVCISYNQERYIAQALDSFLMQNRESFDLEVIIADDASTDSTQDIIREYAAREPAIIKPILRKKNVGVQKNLFGALQAATGAYIALCEGDDYWTDPSKLQRQVDFLEKNPDCTVCFHPVIVKREDNGGEAIYPVHKKGHHYTLNELLQHNFIQTNSVMYRNGGEITSVCLDGIMPLDWLIHIFHAKGGKIGFINRPMAVYRRHPGGMWWKDSKNQIEFWHRNAIRHVRFFENVEKLFEGDSFHLSIIHKSIAEFIDGVCYEVGRNDHYDIVTELARIFPRYVAMALTDDVSEGTLPYAQIKELKSRVNQISEECDTLKRDKQDLLAKNHQLHKQLNGIVNSKSWRVTKPLRALKKGRKH